MICIEKFVELSRYIGERFDLVQAGGGNTSVKSENNEMVIKASGYTLSEVNSSEGYAIVNNTEVLDILKNDKVLSCSVKREKDDIANVCMQKTILSGERPSIETFLHSMLYKYTAHVHSVSVNALSSCIDWQEQLKLVDKDAMFVEYKTPGIELALEMKEKMNGYFSDYNIKPKVTFLQNHGVIISSDNIDELYELLELITTEAELVAKINLSKYKFTNKISKLVNGVSSEGKITYLSEDNVINDILSNNTNFSSCLPFSPDSLVYCGFEVVEMMNIDNDNSIRNYYEKYLELPKVISFNNMVFIIADNIKKAKQIEELLKNDLIIMKSSYRKINTLETKELMYLSNWEAEKYRQKK